MKLTHLLWMVMIILLFSCGVSADHNITLYTPLNDSSCVVGPQVEFNFNIDEAADFCYLHTNETGVFTVSKILGETTLGDHQFFYNFSVPGVDILWGIRCFDAPADEDWSENRSFTLTDAPYCAVLSSTTCPNNISLGGIGNVRTRLGNTEGWWLENQDCNVFITNSGGVVVKSFDTMMYSQDVELTVDDEGNWISRAEKKVPLTDSQGWYVFPFEVSRDWAWYGEQYTINVVCNGVSATCNFNASKEKLPDTDEAKAYAKEAGGIFFGGIVVFILILAGLREAWLRLKGDKK